MILVMWAIIALCLAFSLGCEIIGRKYQKRIESLERTVEEVKMIQNRLGTATGNGLQWDLDPDPNNSS